MMGLVTKEAGPVQGTVVVVDDDREMTRAIARLLRASGLDAVTFPSAEALLAETPPRADCLILDVNMPGLSGFELRTRLQDLGVRAPVIFITAYDDPQSRARAAASGAAAYLAKPFRGEKLLAVLAGALA
jgi:FixJ family two-component response regulator